MSYQVNQACYPTTLAAAQATATSQIGAVVQQGTELYTVNVSTITGTTINYTFTPLGGGTVLTLASPYSAQECQLLDLADGLQLGWVVVGAWLAAYAVMFMSRALRGETGGSYGNT